MSILTTKKQQNSQTYEPEIVVFLDGKRVTSLSMFDPNLIGFYGESVVEESEAICRQELRYWSFTEEQIQQILSEVLANAPKVQPKIPPKRYPQATTLESELGNIRLTDQQLREVLAVVKKYI